MRYSKAFWLLATGLLFSLASLQAVSAGPPKNATVDEIDSATIVQAQGVDQSVDYASLRRFGPWDDRNYQLTQADIAVLPADDEYRYGVPAFFKIEKRREMAAEGYPIIEHYPRELDKDFLIRYGGLLQDGVLHRRGLGIYYHPDPANPPPPLMYASDPIVKSLGTAVPVNGETAMAIGNNETSLKYNPIDPMIVIAGSNGPGGQSQNYSSDGGATWFSAGVLPSTCCDPAMEWSADGTVAYAATLPSAGGLRAGLFRSTDNGQTWGSVIVVSTGSSDKEWIHVDKSPSSPHLENVYLTWHQGNVMFFSRSTNKGLTWSTPISFPSAARGIGSDITTDSAGNVYYIWPGTSVANIYMVKSTDGGLTFGSPVIVQPLFDTFDFPIPSMESRLAFIYIAADTDRSGGPNDGRIYAAYTALHPSSGGSTSTNHAWIQVAYSDDGGATWGLTTTPHSEADIATIDRYHPWLEVDEGGAVHIGFYDTRHSPARTGVDFYYNYSVDGGTTWLDETRVSAVTSVNITNGQEWGDYNGIAAGPSEAAMSWTDNRPGGGGTPVQRSYVGRVQNLAAGPTYTVTSPDPAEVAVCAGNPVPQRTLTLQGLSGYSGSAAITFPGLDPLAFPTATATPNPVPVGAGPANTLINLTTAPTASSGDYEVTVLANDGGVPAIVRQVEFTVQIAAGVPAAASLTTPANNATGTSLAPSFTWLAVASAVSYEVEIATDAGFSNIVDSGSVTEPAYTPATTLDPETAYFWRVRAVNACGDGAYSATWQFTTGFLICFSGPAISIPDNNTTGATAPLAVAAGGTIDDLNLDLDITHTWPGDLDVQLSNGTISVTLGTRLGGTGCNVPNVDVTFDDQAAQPLACGVSSPGISGVRQPANPLSVFSGSPLAANWTLRVFDRANQDTGQIESFCLVPGLLPDLIYADGFDPPPP